MRRWDLVTTDHVALRNVPAAVQRISRFHGEASPVGSYATCMRDMFAWLLVLDCAVAAHVHSQQLGLCLDETPLQGGTLASRRSRGGGRTATLAGVGRPHCGAVTR